MNKTEEESLVDIAIKLEVSDNGRDYLNNTFRAPLNLDPKEFHMTIGYIKDILKSEAFKVAESIQDFLLDYLVSLLVM